jgi:serine/threonine protein kinase
MPQPIGTLLNNRYRIVRILGQGGMGAVYRASDEHLNIQVAVKENLFLTEEYGRQFKSEATILAGLRHPNLPHVSDYFALENQGQYLVMDYIEGEDLRERMEAWARCQSGKHFDWYFHLRSLTYRTTAAIGHPLETSNPEISK